MNYEYEVQDRRSNASNPRVIVKKDGEVVDGLIYNESPSSKLPNREQALEQVRNRYR